VVGDDHAAQVHPGRPIRVLGMKHPLRSTGTELRRLDLLDVLPRHGHAPRRAARARAFTFCGSSGPSAPAGSGEAGPLLAVPRPITGVSTVTQRAVHPAATALRIISGSALGRPARRAGTRAERSQTRAASSTDTFALELRRTPPAPSPHRERRRLPPPGGAASVGDGGQEEPDGEGRAQGASRGYRSRRRRSAPGPEPQRSYASRFQRIVISSAAPRRGMSTVAEAARGGPSLEILE
jgi:hypothetical protein